MKTIEFLLSDLEKQYRKSQYAILERAMNCAYQDEYMQSRFKEVLIQLEEKYIQLRSDLLQSTNFITANEKGYEK